MKKIIVVLLFGSAMALAGLAAANQGAQSTAMQPATVCPHGYMPSANVRLAACPKGTKRHYRHGLENPNQGPQECVSACLRR